MTAQCRQQQLRHSILTETWMYTTQRREISGIRIMLPKAERLMTAVQQHTAIAPDNQQQTAVQQRLHMRQ